jgi:hypothetical protein
MVVGWLVGRLVDTESVAKFSERRVGIDLTIRKVVTSGRIFNLGDNQIAKCDHLREPKQWSAD